MKEVTRVGGVSSRPAAAPDVGPDCQASEPSIGVELLHFPRTLCASGNYRQLEQCFIEGFGRLFDLPMSALYTLDPWTEGPQRVASAGVSDTFLARYELETREVDLLLMQVHTTQRAVYNMAAMASMDSWLEHPLYTKVKYLHDIRHEIQAPVVNRGAVASRTSYICVRARDLRPRAGGAEQQAGCKLPTRRQR